MTKQKKPTLAEQLKEQKEAMEQMKQLLAESEAKREQQQLDIETIEAKRAEEAEKQAKLKAIEESKRRTGGNINTTLSEYHYKLIHNLAKQQHSKAATIVRSIIEQYCDTLDKEE